MHQAMKQLAPFEEKIAAMITDNERESRAREEAEKALGLAYQEADRKAAEEKFKLTLKAYVNSATAIFEDLEVRETIVPIAPGPKGESKTGVEKSYPPYKESFAKNPKALQESTDYQLFLRAGNVLTEHTGLLGVGLFEVAVKGELQNPYSKQ